MNTKKFFMLLAAVLLGSVSAFAQSGNNEPLRGDVNEDGTVDVADIAAVIAIIKNNAEPQTTYYWYVGQTDPSTMTNISPIVTDTTSPGWREIGTSIPTYTMNNPLWDGAANKITTGASKATTYVALPNTTLKMRDSEGDVLDFWINNGTKTINNVTYTIYQTPSAIKVFNNIIF